MLAVRTTHYNIFSARVTTRSYLAGVAAAVDVPTGRACRPGVAVPLAVRCSSGRRVYPTPQTGLLLAPHGTVAPEARHSRDRNELRGACIRDRYRRLRQDIGASPAFNVSGHDQQHPTSQSHQAHENLKAAMTLRRSPNHWAVPPVIRRFSQ